MTIIPIDIYLKNVRTAFRAPARQNVNFITFKKRFENE